MQVTTIGLDIAKSMFQVHGADARGKVVLRKRSWRAARCSSSSPTCRAAVVGMEACGGAHYWARELTKLGHEVRLMPPQYVKPYVKTNKHDAADAEACCEAVQRPSMRFVPVKSEEQQALLMLHRIRDRLIAERTGTINAIRGHMAEFGIVAARRAGRPAGAAGDHLGRRGRAAAAAGTRAAGELRSSTCGRSRRGSPSSTGAWCGRPATTRPAGRLTEVPGIGPVIATAMVATVGDAKAVQQRPAASPPGSGSPRASTRPAARSGCSASASAATAICGGS